MINYSCCLFQGPECDDEVDELLADPGPVPQWGIVVHPLPRDGDERGVYVLIANL